MDYSVTIDSQTGVTLCGVSLDVASRGSAMLVELYRGHVADYPKFFKMDTASRLGFMAAELLLNVEGDRFRERSDRSLIFGGANDSKAQDVAFQATINDKNNYFPSPALFVYTLPNIVTAEVAIRNHYQGETMYYALSDASRLWHLAELTLKSCAATSVLAAWLNVIERDKFSCQMRLMYAQ
ncbi:MAG TPA: hypothetical protein DEO38_03130 [Bacteroidales bacterium]|nr:hypothetical protein [Bacteroidales bacterium]